MQKSKMSKAPKSPGLKLKQTSKDGSVTNQKYAQSVRSRNFDEKSPNVESLHYQSTE